MEHLDKFCKLAHQQGVLHRFPPAPTHRQGEAAHLRGGRRVGQDCHHGRRHDGRRAELRQRRPRPQGGGGDVTSSFFFSPTSQSLSIYSLSLYLYICILYDAEKCLHIF